MTPHEINRAFSGALMWLDDPRLMAALEPEVRGQLADLVWRLGYLAAAVDPWAGEPDDDGANPFGTATERNP